MALIPPLRVRDMNPSEHVVPPPAWARVVEELGDEIIARPTSTRCTKGNIHFGVERDETTWAKVQQVLLEWVQESEPWVTTLDPEEPWATDPEAWKG